MQSTKHGKIILLSAILLIFSCDLFAQNTRGDRPISGQQSSRDRANKKNSKFGFRLPSRISSNRSSQSSRAGSFSPPSGKDKAAKPLGKIFNTPPNENRKVHTGDIAGQRIRTNTISAQRARKNRNVYTAKNPYQKYVSKKSKQTQKPWVGDYRGKPIEKNVPSRRSENVSREQRVGPSKAQILKKLSKPPKAALKTASGEYPIKIEPTPSDQKTKPKSAISQAISATASFITGRKRNVYWGKFKRGGKAVTTDPAGLALRRKNYSSTLPGIKPFDKSATNNGSGNDKSIAGGSLGNSSTGNENAWLGDPNRSELQKAKPKSNRQVGNDTYSMGASIAKMKLNKPLPKSKKTGIGSGFSGKKREQKQLKSAGNQGYSFRGNSKSNIGVGGGSNLQIRDRNTKGGYSSDGYNFSGFAKQMRPLKGGGSVSGGSLSNGGKPISQNFKITGDNSIGYSGFIRRKGLKSFSTEGASFSGDNKALRKLTGGGGSISGRSWNNKGESTNRPRTGAYQGYSFSGNRRGLKPEVGGGSISGRSWNNKGESNTRPRNGAYQGYSFSGNREVLKPEVGGGSISGRSWNNKGESTTRPRMGAYQGYSFSGNRKVLKPEVGGGSISGRSWNNKEQSITRPRNGAYQGYSFSGEQKATRPEVGGGSVSGKVWNNREQPITRPRNGAYQGYSFSGEQKATRPEVGGGSISGRSWNNKEQSITRPRNGAYQGYSFSGEQKATRPEVGGGSVSGKVWNNKEQPITKPRNGAYQGYSFSGNQRATKPEVGGGGSISGKIWNNNEKPILGRYARNPRIDVSQFGNIPLSRNKIYYIQNTITSPNSLKQRNPVAPAIFRMNDIVMRTRQAKYEVKPNAVELAQKGIAPSNQTIMGSLFSGKQRLKREYVHNPKTSQLALKVLAEPRAYAKIGDYQGNLKMHKPSGKDLHPDAKFAHLGQSNVKQDRTFLTNIKLTWAKMFKKNENEPKAAKPDNHPLRYDRKEKDLWKVLYDNNNIKK